MQRISLPSGKLYDAEYADVSLMTGNFNALVLTMDGLSLAQEFVNAEEITVEEDTGKTYTFTGYKRLVRLVWRDTGYQITLAKEV